MTSPAAGRPVQQDVEIGAGPSNLAPHGDRERFERLPEMRRDLGGEVPGQGAECPASDVLAQTQELGRVEAMLDDGMIRLSNDDQRPAGLD